MCSKCIVVGWNVPRRNSSDKNISELSFRGTLRKPYVLNVSNVFHLAVFRFGILISITKNILKCNFPDDVNIMEINTFIKVRFPHVRNLEKSYFVESTLSTLSQSQHYDSHSHFRFLISISWFRFSFPFPYFSFFTPISICRFHFPF